ncbi:DUF2231 domain-containing protein [Oryzobacter telluris]|uniref:DUF2231 domain-containing protein n=1 Tax=Oryzobacter telluris TaxID=3149179 RepID=UPI00370D6415
MSSLEKAPPQVSLLLRLEELSALDGAVAAIEPTIRSTFGSGARGQVLRGDWLGHALHPVLTDFVLGSWTSATLLDLVGGKSSRGAAQQLVGASLFAVGPTAWTGWAQWSEAGTRDKRVGLVHAVTNGLAIGLYAASYVSRKRGRHEAGARFGLAGATAAAVGGFLGGHLSAARKVGTHHPAFDGTTG